MSKTHGADAIRPLLAAGQRHFGENRVGEAADKWPALQAEHPDVRLHMVGALQSNKAAEVYYGRLQPAHLVGRRCVSADKLANKDGRLIAARCDPSDDSGQLMQFWSLTKQPAAEAGKFMYYVNFIGQPAGDTEDFPGTYTLDKVTLGANKMVRLQHSKEEGKRSAFFLKLA